MGMISAITLVDSCAPCDDCEISPAPKQVKVLNAASKNLLFGASAVYNPDDIVIKDEFGNNIEVFVNIANETVDFTFKTASNSYFIALNNTDTDTVSFVYGKDKNIDCCNEFDVTKTTSVNGKLTSNDDLIEIRK